MTRIFHGKVEDGKLVLNDRQGLQQAIAALDGYAVETLIRKARKSRSGAQNAFYWACVVPMLAEAAGYDPEEMHEALKIKFLSTHVESTLPTVRSTTELSTLEMHEYIERIRRMAAEFFSLNIPDPGCAE